MSLKHILSILILCGAVSGCSWSNVQEPVQQNYPSTVNTETDLTVQSTPQNEVSKNINTTLLIQVLQRQIGRPYLYGGNTPAGFDCSGLVQYSFAQIGAILPRATQDQMSNLESINKAQIKAGDLVFFQTGKKQYHVAVMTDSHNFIHAPSSGKSVSTSSFSNPYWQKNFIGARRY